MKEKRVKVFFELSFEKAENRRFRALFRMNPKFGPKS